MISQDNENQYNEGIVKINQNGIEYTVWTMADFIKPYIVKFLKDKFPGMLIVRELNKIDLTIPEDNLAVEVESTHLIGTHFSYSGWENSIRCQIEQNINNYGRCWFFFDSEFLRAMRNASRGISVNMDWFRKLMKEEKLKVFTVSYDGIIEDKEYNDFDFLSEMSKTCQIASKTDDMILNNNKMKIYINVIKGYGFSQTEIEKFDNDFVEYCRLNKINDKSKNDTKKQFLGKENDERSSLYGKILCAIGNLPGINQLLDKKSNNKTAKYHAKFLGIFYVGGPNNFPITKFIDIFDICKYFPGYLRNKGTWDKLKGHNLNARQFDNVVTGRTDVINGLDYYYHTEDKEDNKDVNVKIENKDQIMVIDDLHVNNIHQKIKQIEIDCAWNG